MINRLPDHSYVLSIRDPITHLIYRQLDYIDWHKTEELINKYADSPSYDDHLNIHVNCVLCNHRRLKDIADLMKSIIQPTTAQSHNDKICYTWNDAVAEVTLLYNIGILRWHSYVFLQFLLFLFSTEFYQQFFITLDS